MILADWPGGQFWEDGRMAGVSARGAATAGLLAGVAGTGLAAASAGVAWHRLARRALPQEEGRLEVPGLSGPVTVRRDRWGVPFIEAREREDLGFAQGFVHAQDRA
jgi:acyl-homoserine lactone acylase PvdQ